MAEGLTSKELKTFSELLIKANDGQVALMVTSCNLEVDKREKGKG